MGIYVPQDRESSFKPKVVRKRQKDISGIEDKIIAMHVKGLKYLSRLKIFMVLR